MELLKNNAYLGITLKIVVIVLITIIVARALKAWISREEKTKPSLYKKFIYYILIVVVYITGVTSAINQIPGLSNITQTILAGSGIVALALSLSAQESLNNIISGMFMTLFKPFEIGDRVTLVTSNLTGTIEDITLRHTVIKTFINSRIIVPNSVINKEIIENSNLIDSRASSFVDIAISYESDIEKAMEIMARAIGEHPLYVDVRTEEEKQTQPKVKVYVRELGEYSVILRASMWTKSVNDNFDACSDARLQIRNEFLSNGIEIPYKKVGILKGKETKGNE